MNAVVAAVITAVFGEITIAIMEKIGRYVDKLGKSK
jgi:hypothetical protein